MSAGISTFYTQHSVMQQSSTLPSIFLSLVAIFSLIRFLDLKIYIFNSQESSTFRDETTEHLAKVFDTYVHVVNLIAELHKPFVFFKSFLKLKNQIRSSLLKYHMKSFMSNYNTFEILYVLRNQTSPYFMSPVWCNWTDNYFRSHQHITVCIYDPFQQLSPQFPRNWKFDIDSFKSGVSKVPSLAISF